MYVEKFWEAAIVLGRKIFKRKSYFKDGIIG